MSGKPKDPKKEDDDFPEVETERTLGIDIPEEERTAAPAPQPVHSEEPLSVDLPQETAAPAKPRRSETSLRQDYEKLEAVAATAPKSNEGADHSRVLRKLAMFSFIAILVALVAGWYFMRRASLEPTPQMARAVGTDGATPASAPTPAPAVPMISDGKAAVLIETDMVGFAVLLGGKSVTVFNNSFETEPGDNIEIIVSRVGFDDYRALVRLEAGKVNVIRPVFAAQAKATGFLALETVPSARFVVSQNGKVVLEGNTPAAGLKLPIGKYHLLLENTFIGYRSEEEIEIVDFRTTTIRREIKGN